MILAKTILIEDTNEVDRRLSDLGLVREQLMAVAVVAKTWADDASPLMPTNAPGTLAYIYGVNELREQLLDDSWKVDRTCGVEAVINRDLGIRIGYQNVDRACDAHFPPTPRSAKGSASENLCGPNLFERAGIEAGPLTGVRSDGVPSFYVMVGEDGSVELSQPIIANGSFKHFVERVFISAPGDDWLEDIDPETGPIDDFDISVRFKDSA